MFTISRSWPWTRQCVLTALRCYETLLYHNSSAAAFPLLENTAVAPVITPGLCLPSGVFLVLKPVEVEDEVVEKIVNIRPKAMDHLQELRRSQGSEGDIFLRMGVRSGGCSGLSYIMDLVKKVRNSASVSMALSLIHI